jgi:peptidoglycan/xylan/chitin deacetylase (PgdA/CDA1 family)
MSATLTSPSLDSQGQGLKGLLKNAYRRWRTRRSNGTGKLRHIRRVDLLATFAARAAAPFFPELLWTGRKHVPSRVSPHPGDGKKLLYLTFDDGPHSEGTKKLLKTLERHQVPASFFLIGKNVQAHPELTRDIAEAGHTVGNHTYSHLDAWMHSFGDVANELDQTTALLEELLGQPLLWMRPPHGHFTKKIRGWCRDHGQKLVIWDLMPADFVPWRNSVDIFSSIERHARRGSIVVLHDSDTSLRVTPAAVEQLLPRLIDNGWQFAAL